MWYNLLVGKEVRKNGKNREESGMLFFGQRAV